MREEVYGHQHKINVWDEIKQGQILFVINYSRNWETIELYGLTEAEYFVDDEDDYLTPEEEELLLKSGSVKEYVGWGLSIALMGLISLY